MSLDWFAVASLFGSPVGYAIIGAIGYKFYRTLQEQATSIRILNHNSTIIARALLKKNILTPDEIGDVELNGE